MLVAGQAVEGVLVLGRDAALADGRAVGVGAAALAWLQIAIGGVIHGPAVPVQVVLPAQAVVFHEALVEVAGEHAARWHGVFEDAPGQGRAVGLRHAVDAGQQEVDIVIERPRRIVGEAGLAGLPAVDGGVAHGVFHPVEDEGFDVIHHLALELADHREQRLGAGVLVADAPRLAG